MVLLDPQKSSSCCAGPGYASPAEAIAKAPRERVIFVTTPRYNSNKPDALMTIDVDPTSDTYCQAIGRVDMYYPGDEVHHTGWNACSSCHGDPERSRSHLVLPCLHSSRIYFVNCADPKQLKIDKTIEPDDLLMCDVSFPHTAHCLADGNIMISTLGDKEGNEKGDFVLIDSKSFTFNGSWLAPQSKTAQFNYDFWYQPRMNVMIATEWSAPKLVKQGFSLKHLEEGKYGNKVHIFDWSEKKLRQTIELEKPDGILPFEIRFHHDPTSVHAFCCSALGSAMYLFYRPDGSNDWVAEKVTSIPAKTVEGWLLPEMPALITDILISMDDRFLYCSCFLHGDVRQYDISDPFKPKLVGQVFLAGSIHKESGIKVTKDPELKEQPETRYIKGKRIEGGPQMIQLSIDGKRLYVTTSLYSVWDKQLYPNLIEKGSVMMQLDVDTHNGGLSVNENFLVDFGAMKDGPFLAHEMRYPGGDCTSDIWY